MLKTKLSLAALLVSVSLLSACGDSTTNIVEKTLLLMTVMIMITIMATLVLQAGWLFPRKIPTWCQYMS